MARIRTIKPDFWGDADVSGLSMQARLLLIGLFSMADDDGRFLASANAINGFVFPNDDVSSAKVRRLLQETVTSGVVHVYSVDGIQYGCLPNWHKHQKINRYTPSKLPAPDLECYPMQRGLVPDD